MFVPRLVAACAVLFALVLHIMTFLSAALPPGWVIAPLMLMTMGIFYAMSFALHRVNPRPAPTWNPVETIRAVVWHNLNFLRNISVYVPLFVRLMCVFVIAYAFVNSANTFRQIDALPKIAPAISAPDARAVPPSADPNNPHYIRLTYRMFTGSILLFALLPLVYFSYIHPRRMV